MAEQLTQQQLQAVTDRGGELLVSAAAGSGKTKVLVDRIMSYLTDPNDPADLDGFLIITFTKAAAAELRGKIAAKLTERISQEPNNRHLQQQVQRLYLTSISTVHAFCAELLREYAYKLDLSADFRVAEENECAEIQRRVIQQLLEDTYSSDDVDPDFYTLIESQGFGRDDGRIPDVILKVYNNARCHLDPDAWLDQCVQIMDTTTKSDVSETVWGRYLIEDLHRCLDQQISAMEQCVGMAQKAENMDKPAELLADTLSQLRNLRNCTTWNEIYMNRDVDYRRLTFSKKCTDTDLIARIKLVRDACKKDVSDKLRNFSESSQQAFVGIEESGASTKALVDLVRHFSVAYSQYKQRRKILDFGDLEHKTLDLLLGKERKSRTYLADEIANRFREVMVDEYQDSNAVQDAIYWALTQRKHNCFMVGDVKQSIYQFRLADPGIFLDKYRNFAHADAAQAGKGRKVLLSKNFRSATAVIDAVNAVFELCMSPRVGGLSYGADEKLYEGIPHRKIDEPEVEFHAIGVQEDTYAEEATFVANRIAQLLDGTHMIRDKEELRPITADDIVILLRAPSTSAPPLMRALTHRGIRCSMGGGTDLLRTEEVIVLRSLLQVINNPRQDIPLVAALSSRLFCFTADELAELRSADRNCSIYEVLLKYDSLKARSFLDLLRTLRMEARMNSTASLLSKVFALTRIDSIYGAMDNGEDRMENLQSFCQIAIALEANGAGALDQFLAHIDALEEKGLLTGNDSKETGAVTVMSIHKSKGLEFPVVFLCGMSRSFNKDNSRAQVLCDKELGLGLACVDSVNRVRYPTVCKRAVAAKISADDLSEEMRVLYVAMTRAKDRLIMTYASNKLEKDLYYTNQCMHIYDPEVLAAQALCPGDWLLMAALQRPEATALFKLAGGKGTVHSVSMPWLIDIVNAQDDSGAYAGDTASRECGISAEEVEQLRAGLSFSYPYSEAAIMPSKQTATQLKGRAKDTEAAENTSTSSRYRSWRVPSFIERTERSTDYGTAFHRIMQYIRYEACRDASSVEREIRRLVEEGMIPESHADSVSRESIAAFFTSEVGQKLRSSKNILREFKFSILDDAAGYAPGLKGEKILLQGVVDCAIIDEDGITVIDFKTDRVTEDTILVTAQGYRGQITAYADALSRIYEKPIKDCLLYFARMERFVSVD